MVWKGRACAKPRVCFRILLLLIEAQPPRPCPDLLHEHPWGWRPGTGISHRLPRDSEIKPGLNFDGSSMWVDGSVQGRRAVKWQRERDPGDRHGLDGAAPCRYTRLSPKFGGCANMGRGTTQRTGNTGPAFGALGNSYLKGRPRHRPPFSHQAAVMRLHLPFISKGFSSWRRRHTVVVQQRNASHPGSQPENYLFLA